MVTTIIYLITLLLTPENKYKDYDLIIFGDERHYIHKSISVNLYDIKRQEKRHFERVKNNMYYWELTKINHE